MIDGNPILDPLRNYITIWDFWSPLESESDDEAAAVSRSVNAAQAVERELLSPRESDALVAEFKERLEAVGVEVLRLRPTHILLSLEEGATLARDDQGRLDACLCNFQYLRLPTWSEDQTP